jgi:hypothetical protein
MQPWIFAIVATIVSFIIFKVLNTKKQGENDFQVTTTLSFKNDIVKFALMLVGFMILSYSFNVTGSSIMGGGQGNTSAATTNEITTISDDMERNIVNSILQDVNVGFSPF